MKVLKYIVSIICFSMILLSGCKVYDFAYLNKDDIAIGVIETKGTKNDSRIIFYDNSMNEIGDLDLDYATLGDMFYNPLIVEGDLYIIPQGYANKKDEGKVLRIGLDKLEIEEYLIDQLAMYSIAVSEKYIYTCNNLNKISYINQCDKNSKITKCIEAPNMYITHLFYTQSRLYTFAMSFEADNESFLSYIYVYDESLNLLEQIDISECGIDQCKVVEYNGNIYFTSLRDKNDKPTSVVAKMHLGDGTIDFILLEQEYPLDLAIHEDKLYVTHYDLVQQTGGGVSVYDLNTKELKYYELNHGAKQMFIAHDKIYILSDWKIYVYDTGDMKLLNSVEISHMDEDFSYLSGFFSY